jgi:hypothetical protein
MIERLLVLTTSIGGGEVFDRFFKTYGNATNPPGLKVDYLVIGDKNTPDFKLEELESYSEFTERFDFHFLAWQDQQELMDCKPFMHDLIPWRKIQRRNLGYLLARQGDYDYLITVDDDNYPLDDRFLTQHVSNITSKPDSFMDSIDGSLQWLNPCFKLKGVIHRGFPLKQRYKTPNEKTVLVKSKPSGKVMVSEGFWIGDPDICALTRLDGNPQSVKVEDTEGLEDITVSPRLISPFNTQNTIIRTELAPALYLSPKIGRYDDIWASYFVKALLYVKDGFVSYGSPIVRQDRNDHDIFKDLQDEFFGMKNTLAFVDEMFSTVKQNLEEWSGLDYLELSRSLSEVLLKKSIKYRWYYLDILRWIELLEDAPSIEHESQ